MFSLKLQKKVAVMAAVPVLAAAGVGVTALTASAASPSCAGNCADVFFQKFGPKFLLDNRGQSLQQGNEQMLWPASNNDPAEDYTLDSPGMTHGVLGTVNQVDHADPGLIPANLKVAYGHDYVFQIELSPLGANSGMCVGTWPGQLASAGFKVRAEPCGYTNTLWIADIGHQVTDHHSDVFHADWPLIAAETPSVSNPLVMNYPGNSYPTDSPRPWIVVQPENQYANGAVYNNQEIGAKIGPVS